MINIQRMNHLLHLLVLHLPFFSFAFTSIKKVHHTSRLLLPWSFNKKPNSGLLHEYVFSGPEQDDSSASFRRDALFEDEDGLASSPQVSPAFLDFINKESAALARLAVAYSPKDRTLNIKNINQVSVLALGDNHIDIVALVCDDDSCVSLAVPVSFPKPCKENSTPSEFEMCIIDNLGELSTFASQIVEDTVNVSEEKANGEKANMVAPAVDQELKLQYDMLAKELKSCKDLQYPEWWEHPNLNMKLAKQCDTVRSMLNEKEFQYDLQLLISRTLEVSLKDALEAALADSGKLDSPIEENCAEMDRVIAENTINGQNVEKSVSIAFDCSSGHDDQKYGIFSVIDASPNTNENMQATMASKIQDTNQIFKEELQIDQVVKTMMEGEPDPTGTLRRNLNVSSVVVLQDVSNDAEITNEVLSIETKSLDLIHDEDGIDSSTERNELSKNKTKYAFVVNQVALAALGPAGMIIKASVSSTHATYNEYEIIDIPFPFEALATDEESLRDSVLQIVDGFEVNEL